MKTIEGRLPKKELKNTRKALQVLTAVKLDILEEVAMGKQRNEELFITNTDYLRWREQISEILTKKQYEKLNNRYLNIRNIWTGQGYNQK